MKKRTTKTHSEIMTLREYYLFTPYYTEPSKVIKVIGFVLVGVGILTLPLPTGSPLIIMAGLGLSGYSVKGLKKLLLKSYRLTKYKYNNGLLFNNNNKGGLRE